MQTINGLYVESAFGIYDHPDKGHDRVYVDDNAGVMGIFDGAGGAFGSNVLYAGIEELADEPLPYIVKSLNTRMIDGVNRSFYRIHDSTAMIAKLAVNKSLQKDAVQIDYFNAGDGAIMVVDDGKITTFDYTPSPRDHNRHPVLQPWRWKHKTVMEDFMGRPRTDKEIVERIGSVTLLPGQTFLMIDDGFTRKRNKDIQIQKIGKIVGKNVDLQELPRQIIQAQRNKHDDIGLTAWRIRHATEVDLAV